MSDRMQRRESRQPSASAFSWVGGAACLDFANTASGRGTQKFIDRLHRYDDLLDWCAEAGMLAAKQFATLRKHARAKPEQAARALSTAAALRVSIHGFGRTIAGEGGEPTSEDVEALRSMAAVALRHARLQKSEQGFVWCWPGLTTDCNSPLWPIAHAAAVLFSSAETRRLKQCPAADCGWLFLDRSKNLSRRWCDMQVCGNRHKARRHFIRRGRD